MEFLGTVLDIGSSYYIHITMSCFNFLIHFICKDNAISLAVLVHAVLDLSEAYTTVFYKKNGEKSKHNIVKYGMRNLYLTQHQKI